MTTLLNAAEVAERFAVRPGWVYQHAPDLGAIKLGDGPRARLRFDSARVDEYLARSSTGGATAETAAATRRRSRRRRSPASAELLPIRGERPPAGDTRVTTDERETGRQTRALDKEIVELLDDGVWRTAAEIAERGKGGIGCRRKDVEKCLQGNAHMFVAVNGRKVERSGKAMCYQLKKVAERQAPRETTA